MATQVAGICKERQKQINTNQCASDSFLVAILLLNVCEMNKCVVTCLFAISYIRNARNAIVNQHETNVKQLWNQYQPISTNINHIVIALIALNIQIALIMNHVLLHVQSNDMIPILFHVYHQIHVYA